MQIINLYKYVRDDGGVTVSLNQPDGDYVLNYRLVADVNKFITRNGTDKFHAIDTDTTEGWYEVNKEDEFTDSEFLNELEVMING